MAAPAHSIGGDALKENSPQRWRNVTGQQRGCLV
jgi:hypothetical protein